MVERKIRGRYFVAFLLTACIFALGIFFGIIMSDYKITKIYDSERELTTNFLVHGIQSDLLATEPCAFVNSSLVSNEIFNVGDRLNALENERGKTDSQVISLKQYYTLLQIRDYLFFKGVNEKCKGDFTLNLFFYSNDPKKCEKCEDQGFVLSYARAKNTKLRTYSFDVDIGLPIVNYLAVYYNATTLPSMVFGNQTYNMFLDNEKVEQILNQTQILNETKYPLED